MSNTDKNAYTHEGNINYKPWGDSWSFQNRDAYLSSDLFFKEQ